MWSRGIRKFYCGNCHTQWREKSAAGSGAGCLVAIVSGVLLMGMVSLLLTLI
jgi:hypothetical protein